MPDEKEILSTLKLVGERLIRLDERMDSIDTKINETDKKIKKNEDIDQKKAEMSRAYKEQAEEMTVNSQGLPVPPDITELVGKVLGNGYGILFEKSGNIWMLTLTVPLEHASEESKKAGVPDKRSVVYSPQEGLPKIRLWLDKVKLNVIKQFQKRGEGSPKIS